MAAKMDREREEFIDDEERQDMDPGSNDELSEEEKARLRGDSLGDVSEDEDEDTDDNDGDEDTEEEDEPETSDDEDVSSDEEESDEEDTSEGYRNKDGKWIPRSRFNEVIQQREDARKTAESLEKQVNQLWELLQSSGALKQQGQEGQGKTPEPEAPPEYDFDDAEDKYMEAMLSGETDKAKAIRREIREQEKKLYEHQVSNVSKQATEQAKTEAQRLQDEREFNTLVNKYTQDYGFFNTEHEEYDPQAVQKVNKLMNSFIVSGYSKTEALQEAVDLVAPLYQTEQSTMEKQLSGKEDNPATKRRKEQVKKNSKAAKKQPPNTPSRKQSRERSADEYDITKMTAKEFRSLPEHVKRQLRGD